MTGKRFTSLRGPSSPRTTLPYSHGERTSGQNASDCRIASCTFSHLLPMRNKIGK